jgi:LDH2 family malate/lactate/ureidoglycolate dehydrogenase
VNANDIAQPAAHPTEIRLSPSWLESSIRSVFVAGGLSEGASTRIAQSMTLADMSGVGSHGTMLVPMYIGRLRAGSISRSEVAEVVVDKGAIAVLDAGNGFGHLTGAQAMTLACDKAAEFGIGMTAVGHAFHFGRASDYVRIAIERGMIGIAMANTRPLMPAIGGAEAVVGNNPISIGAPARGRPIVLDMALSQVALGKIRLAEANGSSIPDTWATDADGRPTTDPARAIGGLLLPAAGAKGFGLALMVDILTGVLSGGAFGREVRGLYADLSVPNDCSHSFLAINPAAFGDPEAFYDRIDALRALVVDSRRAPGVDSIKLPGQVEDEAMDRASSRGIVLDPAIVAELFAAAELVGAVLAPLDEAAQA